MLTNARGMLLDYYCSDDFILRKYVIKKGVYFTEKSCGTNAISLALKIKDQVRIMGDEHYCSFLQEWESIAAPIKINNNVVGYLDISAIDNHNIKKEALYLFDRLISKITLEYMKNTIFNNKIKEKLTSTEIKVLYCAASGYSIGETCEKLYLSKSTIYRYRNSICEKLDATNMWQAVYFGAKHNIINITKNNLTR